MCAVRDTGHKVWTKRSESVPPTYQMRWTKKFTRSLISQEKVCPSSIKLDVARVLEQGNAPADQRRHVPGPRIQAFQVAVQAKVMKMFDSTSKPAVWKKTGICMLSRGAGWLGSLQPEGGRRPARARE